MTCGLLDLDRISCGVASMLDEHYSDELMFSGLSMSLITAAEHLMAACMSRTAGGTMLHL